MLPQYVVVGEDGRLSYDGGKKKKKSSLTVAGLSELLKSSWVSLGGPTYAATWGSGRGNGDDYLALNASSPSGISAHLHNSSWQNIFKKYVFLISTNPETRKVFYFLLLNFTFTGVEFIYGWSTNSLGLISDAVHMLFDCTAIVLSLIASVIVEWEATTDFTFGFGRVETLTGFLNAVALIFASLQIVWESIERFFVPEKIETGSLLVVSILGFIVNLVGIFAFDHGMHGHHHHDHGHDHSHSVPAFEPVDHHKTLVSVTSHPHADHSGHGHHSHHHECKDHSHEHHSGHNHEHSYAHHTGHNHDHSHEHHSGHNHDHHAGHAHHHEHSSHSHDHDKKPGQLHHHHSPQQNPAHSEHAHSHGHHSHAHHNHDHGQNPLMHGMFLHILSDTLGSLGVIISTLLIRYYGWLWSDPLCSLFIAVLTIYSSWPLVWSAGKVLLQYCPDKMQARLPQTIEAVQKIPGVLHVRHIRVWELKSGVVYASARIGVASPEQVAAILSVAQALFYECGITDVTLAPEFKE